jgi:Homeodomain-like domain
VLLLVDALLRRADTVEVIGAALMDKAAGLGHRRIAARLGRAEATVRGWLRRFASRAEVLRVVFTALTATISTWAPLPQARAGGVFTAAVEAIGAAAAAAGVRFGVGVVSGWRLVCAVSSGRLLAPGWPEGAGNTSWPWGARH